MSVVVVALSPLLCFPAAPATAADEESFVCFTGGGGVADGSKTTIIGDSITVGATSALETKLTGVKIYAKGSKQFTGVVSSNPTGQQIVEDASTELRNYVVVALGTNGTIPADGVQRMVDTIGADKTIVFVNNYYIGDLNSYSANNTQFAAVASANSNVYVADWANLANADPSTYIDNSDGLGVHPTEAGKQLFAQLVYDTLSGVTESDGSSGGGGDGGSSGELNGPAPTSLTGENNEQKTWNYLKTRGLTDIAAAGAMGNIRHESSFDPFVGEYGGGGGYGLIQWTPANSINGKGGDKVMANRGESGTAYDKVIGYDNANDNDGGLLFELDALWEYAGVGFWEELNAETSVGSYTDPIPASNSIGQFTGDYKGKGSAYHFHASIERSGDQDQGLNANGEPNPSRNGHGNIRKRPHAAEEYLSLYGGTGGGGSCGGGGGGSYGNIAEAARTLAQPNVPGNDAPDNPTEAYKTKFQEIDQWTGIAGGDWCGGYLGFGASCDRFVATVLYAAGAVTKDEAKTILTISAQRSYFESHTDKWEKRTPFSSESELQPGDVLSKSGSHVMIYVGNGEQAGASCTTTPPISKDGATGRVRGLYGAGEYDVYRYKG